MTTLPPIVQTMHTGTGQVVLVDVSEIQAVGTINVPGVKPGMVLRSELLLRGGHPLPVMEIVEAAPPAAQKVGIRWLAREAD